MTDNQNNVQTSVQQVDLDIDSWLGAPGADSIVTPTTEDKKDQKPNIFSQGKFDTNFLDEDDDTDTDDKDPDGADDKKDKDPAAAGFFVDATHHLHLKN